MERHTKVEVAVQRQYYDFNKKEDVWQTVWIQDVKEEANVRRVFGMNKDEEPKRKFRLVKITTETEELD